MFRFVTFLAFALLTSALPAEKILEEELTLALQEALAPYDPFIIDEVTDLHITTDHSSITFNAYNVDASGFSHVEVTNFVPPLSETHDVVIAVVIPTLAFHSNDYNLDGTHNGDPISTSGTGSITAFGFGAEVKFKSESVSISPLSMCIQAGSFSMDIFVDNFDCALDGADEINEDINNNAPGFLESVEEQLNANADAIVDAINGALCTSRR